MLQHCASYAGLCVSTVLLPILSERITDFVASRHHGLTKENPGAGKLRRGEVSEMNRRPDRMLASIRF